MRGKHPKSAPCRVSIVWYHTGKIQSDCTNKCLRIIYPLLNNTTLTLKHTSNAIHRHSPHSHTFLHTPTQRAHQYTMYVDILLDVQRSLLITCLYCDCNMGPFCRSTIMIIFIVKLTNVDRGIGVITCITAHSNTADVFTPFHELWLYVQYRKVQFSKSDCEAGAIWQM